MDPKTCGAFIRRCRTARGLSQQQLARELHVTREAVSKWENGRGFPDISLLPALARALDVRVSELLSAEPGVPEEKALNSWFYLTEQERALRRRHSCWLLLAVLLAMALSLTDAGRWLLLPLGLLAPVLPLVCALNERISLGSIVLSSFGCGLAVLLNELLQIRHRALVGDWAGIGDTAGVSVALCAALSFLTILFNALLLAYRKQ